MDLHRGDDLLASWVAASGITTRQNAIAAGVRGMQSPLPVDVYSLGLPEPWGNGLWFALNPRFSTTGRALGIHCCYPGTGWICFPSRAEFDALAATRVSQADLRRLTVLN